MHILILAGGGGTRLWPLSRNDFPKQFLHFGDPHSLLQKSVERFLSCPFAQSISISTNEQYAPLVKQQLEKINPSKRCRIIIEPCRKNTGPAIAFAIKQLESEIQENDSLLVLPSDHLIEPQTILTHYLERIDPLLKNNQLFLFGIRPTKPETGFGYIQIGEKQDLLSYQVKRFIEKPNQQLAEQLIASRDYYWNSGMFAFSIRYFWEILQQHAPLIFEYAQAGDFEKMPEISFDYAVVEKCQNMVVCPLPVSWSDVGCWDSVYDMMNKDQNQNAKLGNIIDIETKNSLIIGGKRLISTFGLEDVIIVETDDATFVTKKGKSQKVKEIVNQLITIGKKEGAKHAMQRHPWGTIQVIEETNKYCIQRIEIDPQETWEDVSSLSGKLISLSETQFESMEIKQGQNIKIHNRSENPISFLFLIQTYTETT